MGGRRARTGSGDPNARTAATQAPDHLRLLEAMEVRRERDVIGAYTGRGVIGVSGSSSAVMAPLAMKYPNSSMVNPVPTLSALSIHGPASVGMLKCIFTFPDSPGHNRSRSSG